MPSEYFGRVLRLWSKNAAGPVAAVCALILPIAGVSFHLSSAATIWLGVGPLFIAILLTWPAPYQVWRETRAGHEKEVGEERKNREAVEVSNSRPEIQGELNSFRLSGNPGESRTGNVWRCYASAACKMFVCNSKPLKETL